MCPTFLPKTSSINSAPMRLRKKRGLRSVPLKVAARNEAKKHRVVLSRFENAAKKILKVLGHKKTELSVLLTSDAGIRKINRKFLRHDYATDVIAFGSGDIVISLDTAAV